MSRAPSILLPPRVLSQAAFSFDNKYTFWTTSSTPMVLATTYTNGLFLSPAHTSLSFRFQLLAGHIYLDEHLSIDISKSSLSYPLNHFLLPVDGNTLPFPLEIEPCKSPSVPPKMVLRLSFSLWCVCV